MIDPRRLADLRERAERCLACEAPSPAQARELAAAVLSMLSAFEASGPHPYRTAAPAAEPAALSTSAALERALDDANAQLAAARAELAKR